MKICYSCFREYGDAYSVCPHCGKVEIKYGKEPIHLVPGTVLCNRYIIGESVGSGGFGIVYRAWDMKFEHIIAIKEFFVPRLMTRAQGLKNVIINKKTQVEFEYRRDRFLAEARTMAKFGRHRSIPNVFEFFEENNTAYIVMELLQGMTLSNYIKQLNGKISVDFAVTIAIEIANALKSLHSEGIIHCDVAPDNIFICGGKNIRLKLMDLGAAKLSDSTDDVVDIILKPGYSPTEQYDNLKGLGPWTDIYALGATIYAALTGVKPEEATDRKKEDHVVDPMQLNPEISESLNNTIMKAMAIERHMRFKNADELIEALSGDRKVIPIHKEKSRRRLKRNLSVIAACLAVVIAGGFVINSYFEKKNEDLLQNGTVIDVWFCIENNKAVDSEDQQPEVTQMENIKNIFENHWENEYSRAVTINFRYIPEEEYEEELYRAYEDGNMPDLFESTFLSDEFLIECEAISLESVKESNEYKNSYARYYDDSDFKIPLAVNLPVALVVESTEGGGYFDDISFFGDAEIFYDNNSNIVGSCFGNNSYNDAETFFGLREPGSVLLTDTESMAAAEVKTIRATSAFFYDNYTDFYFEFTRQWSISGQGSEEDVKGARILLTQMLGEGCQTFIAGDSVPVCEKSLNIEGGFGPVKELYEYLEY